MIDSSPMLPKRLYWVIPLAAGLLFCWPLLTRSHLPWGMDLTFASQLTQTMAEGLSDGYLYPRWADSMNRGFGGPVLIFYSPLSYYASAAFALLTGDVAMGIRLTAVLGVLLAGASFYLSARPLTSQMGAALGAALYILLPYHALDLYDRFAFAELASFIWLPPLFRFVQQLADEPRWGSALGLCLAYAGLLLTHLISAYLVLLALVPYAAIRVGRRQALRKLGWMAGAGAAALLLCAIFLLPVLVERPEVHLEFTVESYFGDWHRNFAFRDGAAFGYRPDPIKTSVNLSVATQALLTAIALAVVLLRARGQARQEGLRFALLGGWVTLLQLPVSTPAWATLPELGNVQFPWRFGALQGLFTALTFACALAPARADAPRLARPAVTAVALALAAAPALYASTRDVELRQYVFDHSLALEERLRSKVFLEYTPRAIPIELLKKLRKLPPTVGREVRLDGPGQAEIVHWSSHRRTLRVRQDRPGALWVGTFAYPGWAAWIDGIPAEIQTDARLGAIQIQVPGGDHEIQLEFGSTPARRIGAALSALAALGLVAGSIALKGRRRRSAAV